MKEFKAINSSVRLKKSKILMDNSELTDTNNFIEKDYNKNSTKSKKTNTNNIKNTEDDDSDDSQNFRDKDKELKESIRSKLSLETQDAINLSDDELNNIIEQLKKRGLSPEKGIELQKLRNISRSALQLVK